MSTKTYGSLQPNGNMTKLRKNFQITARSAAKIENGAGRTALDVLQKCGDILADVMVFRTRPERIGTFVVPSQALARKFFSGRAGRYSTGLSRTSFSGGDYFIQINRQGSPVALRGASTVLG